MTIESIKDPIDPKEDKSATGWAGVDVLKILWESRKLIAYFVLFVAIASIAVSLLLPKWYTSAATLLPPKNQGLLGNFGGLSAILKEVAPSAAGKLGSQSGTYNYLAILGSRKAAELVIRRFDLMQEYAIEDSSMEDAIKEFDRNFDVVVTDEAAIRLELTDRDSLRASAMANYMVDVLNNISIELGTGEARSTRAFLEKRVEENKSELKSAEDSLRNFQERCGMIFLPEDAKSVASSVGSLYARKVRAEIELAILGKTSGSLSDAYKQLEVERTVVERRLQSFPRLSIETYRLYRDILIQQKIMEILVPLYEQAKIEERKDVPVMLVLDKAVPAEKKSRPKRLILVSSSVLSALVISVVFVLARKRFSELAENGESPFHRFVAHISHKTA
jgi:uncharacterized protein involved in exopolysaccharide biosynthesis